MSFDILKEVGEGIFKPMLSNPYVYFILLIFITLLGGMDELLNALLCLMFIDIVVCLIAKERPNEGLFKTKFKILIMVIIGSLMDKFLGLEGVSLLSARVCIIYGYGYNQITSIINTLALDPNFYIPPKLRGVVEKLREKAEGESQEWE